MTPKSEVWLLEASMPYEGSYIVAIYSDEDMANCRKDRIEASNRRYDKTYERFSELTEGLGDDDEWPEFPKIPDHYGYDIEVIKRRVITPAK